MTQTTIWSTTIKRLGLNVICGLEHGCYYCPVFGSRHTLPASTNSITGQRNIRIFAYRGHTYFVKEVWHARDSMLYFQFGLYIPPRTDEKAILCPVLMQSKDLAKVLYFNVAGTIEETTMWSQIGDA